MKSWVIPVLDVVLSATIAGAVCSFIRPSAVIYVVGISLVVSATLWTYRLTRDVK